MVMESVDVLGNMTDLNVTTMVPDMTTAVPGGDVPKVWGFVAAGVAVLFFGSNFVPVKKFETGDGMFFQWVLCASIWLTGLVVHCVRNFPPFYPLAMAGGLIWATGNLTVVPIIKSIGLGRGILIWGSFNLLSGWVSGRFGLFGIKPEVPKKEVLNYVGMGLCLTSAFIYIFIKSESGQRLPDPIEEEVDPLLPKTDHVLATNDDVVIINPDDTFIERMSPRKKQIVGTIIAVIAGLFYGLNFVPVIYIQDNYDNASQNGLDYVFAHFSGIFASSSLYFTIYCVVMRNKPKVYPKVILPGMVSGVMWAIADSGWFVANAVLSEPVSFPIITSGPGMVGALWGVILFREIGGKKNLILLGIAFSITIAGSVLTGFSKS